jgi:hypothetical protein
MVGGVPQPTVQQSARESAAVAPPPPPRTAQPMPVRSAPVALRDQLRALDNAGVVRRNDDNCITSDFQRVYDVPCEQASRMSPKDIYDAAKAALDKLTDVSIPSWRDPEARRRYYSLVLDYAWIMIWAGNFIGDTGVGWATPITSGNRPGSIALGAPSNWRDRIPPPDYGAGVGDFEWGPGYHDLALGDRYHSFPYTGADPTNLWACDFLVAGGAPVTDFGAELGRKYTRPDGTVVYATTGYLLTSWAHSVAFYFSRLDFYRFQADGLKRYADYIATWPAEWGDASDLAAAANRAAADAGTISDVRTAVATGLGVAAAAVNVVPVFGQIASAVLGIVAGLVAFVNVDTGIHCPRSCNYRVLLNTDCPPTPATPPGPPVKSPGAGAGGGGGSAAPKKISAPVLVGGVVVALGLGYVLFRAKRG